MPATPLLTDARPPFPILMDIRSPTHFNHTYASEHSGPSQKKNSLTLQMKSFDCITVLTMWVDIIENVHHEQCSQLETHIGSSNALINLQLQCILPTRWWESFVCKQDAQLAYHSRIPSRTQWLGNCDYKHIWTRFHSLHMHLSQATETWSRSSSLLAR